MNKRKYARILIYITTAILCAIIVIQLYLTARADKQMYRNKQNIKSHMADRKRSG